MQKKQNKRRQNIKAKQRLIITWKPDVLHMIEHNGSFTKDWGEDNYIGGTCRSEREVFRNIKTREQAEKVLSKRNKDQILFATHNNVVIHSAI